MNKYKVRPSTNLFCTIAEEWKQEPKAAISLMLSHGARVNGHCEDRPLMSAVARGNTQMINALLESRADPMKPTGPGGESALHIAARCGRFEATRLLLDHGVPADLPDRMGRTPLSVAERGKELHMASCGKGQKCERCEARIQVYGELSYRTQRKTTSSAAAPPSGDVAPNDEESAVSSSEWQASESDVSDIGEWDTDEEDFEGENENSDEDDEEDVEEY